LLLLLLGQEAGRLMAVVAGGAGGRCVPHDEACTIGDC
jgi:hypothetical protein